VNNVHDSQDPRFIALPRQLRADLVPRLSHRRRTVRAARASLALSPKP